VDNEWDHRFEPSGDRLLENILFALWFVLSIPVMVFAIGSMAFGFDASLKVYILLASCWMYPVVLVVAIILRKKLRRAVYLPALNAVAIIAVYTWGILIRFQS
jgi:hypothetical protein